MRLSISSSNTLLMDGEFPLRKRFVRIACWLIAIFTIPSALLYFAFGLPPQYRETFLGGLAEKASILEQASTPRIIIVGGSSVAFGLRSDLLEKEFQGYSVVNMGMYAGLGSTVTLELTAQYLQPGDIVIFSPEQSKQTLSMYFNAEAMWQAADGNWALLRAAQPEYRNALIGQFPYFAAQKARFFRDKTAPSGEGIYSRSSFNQWGDIFSGIRETNKMTDAYDPNMPIMFNADLPTADFISYINDYAAICKSMGVALYYRFCPMNAAAVTETERMKVTAYQETLSSRLDFPVLGQAENAILDPVWFYDTNFHLNSAGAIVNTAQLAGELKAAMGLASSVTFPIPEMPDMLNQTYFTGDDRDADCFLYNQTENGLQITGLAEQCVYKTDLILPTRYQNEPVVGFDAETFAGNETIESVVVQANITVIENGSFNGCSSLKRLILSQSSPSQCAVGNGLLFGTSADIYVPTESLGVYKTNYFWSVYASHIKDGAPYLTALDTPDTLQPATPQPTGQPKSQRITIRYEGNSGTLLAGTGTAMETTYTIGFLRVNTLQGTNVFERDEYVQTCWNTKADGSGISIGLGSRIDAQDDLVLYAQWLAETSAQDFTWDIQDNEAWITGYSGDDPLCVIPAMLGNIPVRGIRESAFFGASIRTLVLSPGLYTVESYAFAQSAVEEVYLYDSLQFIDDSTFDQCNTLRTLHINAATSPVYSISYYATFADKYDRLLSIQGQKKLVLFAGSSTRFGFDSEKLSKAFPAYQVANMGVYAYSNALPQLEIIRQHMDAGDVLLHTPEFDTLQNQFCEKTALDEHFYAMMEANYDMVAELDMREYTEVFSSMNTYLAIRQDMPKLSYADSPAHYDDDGVHYLRDTYNKYGDITILRPNENRDELLQYMRANYTTVPFHEGRLAALNREYQRFLAQDIIVFFSYSPRNRSSLTAESTPEARAELDQLLRKELCVPVISDMEESLLSGMYFYIIDSHLSTEGVAIRTERIIRDLQLWLIDD